ncbi:MAG: sulfatase, partial [Chloroflexota bacterium]
MRILHRIMTVLIMAVFLASCSLFDKDPLPEITVPKNILTGYSTPQYDLPQYNIILILTDDQRYDTLQYMPNVQELLVDQGINFTNAFATTPHCAPSRANIFTGMYAHNNGMLQNDGPFGGFFAFDDSFSVNLWLQDAGYTTGLIGKYLNGYKPNENDWYTPPGWDYWLIQKNDDSEENISGRYFNYTMYENGKNIIVGGAPEDYGTDLMAQRAVKFIQDSAGEQPFFLFFSPPAPHFPAVPAPRHEGFYNDITLWRPESFNVPETPDDKAIDPALLAENDDFRISQLNSLLAVDDAVASIVSALEESGELNTTLIVFTSDHGYLWGEHALAMVKSTFYDESLRVPFVVRFPGMSTSPRIVEEYGLLVDLAPTFTEIAGLGSPEGIDGVSLLPLIFGDDVNWREEFIFEIWKTDNLRLTKGIITREWKLTVIEDEVDFLFNRLEDPLELNNLAGEAQ